MQEAIYFKILQRRNRYRNPKNITAVPEDLVYGEAEYREASEYIQTLRNYNIKHTYPGHIDYPECLLKMKEPPLFLEYWGEPIWKSFAMLSVVGSRDIDVLSEQWMRHHLNSFLSKCGDYVSIVSGGAKGVDQLSHLIAIGAHRPTIFVLPSGILDLYPKSLETFRQMQLRAPICFLTEFELTQQIHKSHFYFRNRIIAALGSLTLVVQASMKSGSLLTVHHCLENGKPVLTIPAHPQMSKFEGNIKLLQDGAFLVRGGDDLLDVWYAETRPF